jgi:hypothetical protein
MNNQEKGKIILFYRKRNRNARQLVEMYADQYPSRYYPSNTLFIKIEKLLINYEAFL